MECVNESRPRPDHDNRLCSCSQDSLVLCFLQEANPLRAVLHLPEVIIATRLFSETRTRPYRRVCHTHTCCCLNHAVPCWWKSQTPFIWAFVYVVQASLNESEFQVISTVVTVKGPFKMKVKFHKPLSGVWSLLAMFLVGVFMHKC